MASFPSQSSSSTSKSYVDYFQLEDLEINPSLATPSQMNPQGMVRSMGYNFPELSEDIDLLATSPSDFYEVSRKEMQFTPLPPNASLNATIRTTKKIASSSSNSPLRKAVSEEAAEDRRKIVSSQDKACEDTLRRQFSLPESSDKEEFLGSCSSSSKIPEIVSQEERKFLDREFKIEKDKKFITAILEETSKKTCQQMKNEPQKGFAYKKEKLLVNTSTIQFGWKGKRFRIPFDLEVGICSQMSVRPERKRIEDKHLAIGLDLTLRNGEKHTAALFGVFDGHGGTSEAAEFAAADLPDQIERALIEENPEGLSQKGIYDALEAAFSKTNQEYRGEGGASAVVCLILNGELWTAGVGIARASIVLNDGEIFQLSFDHKADFCKKEIHQRGGIVAKGYLMGSCNKGLLFGRSLGDIKFRPFISSKPDITAFPLSEIVSSSGGSAMLASSGIHKAGSTIEVAKEVFQQIKRSPKTTSQIIVSAARYQGSKEDLTFLMVRFKKNEERLPQL